MCRDRASTGKRTKNPKQMKGARSFPPFLGLLLRVHSPRLAFPLNLGRAIPPLGAEAIVEDRGRFGPRNLDRIVLSPWVSTPLGMPARRHALPTGSFPPKTMHFSQ